MIAKFALLACLVGLARAGALLSGGLGYGAYGGHGGYGSYGGYGGYGGYGHGYNNYVGGHAISHVAVSKQVAAPAVAYGGYGGYAGYAHGAYAPAVSYANQYSVHGPNHGYAGYASPAYGSYGHGGYGDW